MTPNIDFTKKISQKINLNFLPSTLGKLKPASAFMTGKMKLQGDMGKALKLEKVMGQMKSRSYHTMMPNHQRGKL